jgi:hypothetical protein
MRIKQRLVEALQRHGVIGHNAFREQIRASQWTGPGDTFRFDFGYTPVHPTLEVRLIHVVPLLREGELAETLRSKFQAVLRQCPARLIVGHEDIADPANALVRCSQDALRGQHVLLVPVASFGEFARWVRWELPM